jgi:hypothetical protein
MSPEETDARWLLEEYPKWYQEIRKKPAPAIKPAVDFLAAAKLMEYHTRDEIESMARAFLDSTSKRTAWAPQRTFAQFVSMEQRLTEFVRGARADATAEHEH